MDEEGAEGEAKEGKGLGERSVVNRVPPSPGSPPYNASALAARILLEDATYRGAKPQSMLGNLCAALHRTARRGLVSVLDIACSAR